MRKKFFIALLSKKQVKQQNKYQSLTYKTRCAKRSEVQATCFCKSYDVLKDKVAHAWIRITFQGDLWRVLP